MSDELLQHKIDLLEDQIENIERSGFFTEKEIDQSTASLRMQLAAFKQNQAFAEFRNAMANAAKGLSTMQIRANSIFVNDPELVK